MNKDEIRAEVARVIRSVAPETQPEDLKPEVNFRDELDLDSVDFMNVVVGLHQSFGVDIPEADYDSVSTIGGCVEYVAARLPSGR